MPSLSFAVPIKYIFVPIFDTGSDGCIFVKTNEIGFGVGGNQFGQLGNNSTEILGIPSPVSIAGTYKFFKKISLGGTFALGINNNKIWAWGSNYYGELGDNSTTSRSTPISVGGANKTFCEISTATYWFSSAIDNYGQVWSWGFNGSGQLGDNSTTSRLTPVSICGAKKTFCKISLGAFFAQAIDKNGRLWGWGANDFGQLGDNSVSSRITPVSVLGAVKTFCQIATGFEHSIAIDLRGRIWTWGYNSFGQLGNNSTISRRTPGSILGQNKTFCKVAAGRSISAGIDLRGLAWVWGNNFNYRLGKNSNLACLRTPVAIAGATKTFCDIKAGDNFFYAIDYRGKIFSWGSNNRGANGIGFRSDSPTQLRGQTKTFSFISNFKNITSGYNGSCLAIDKYGTIWSWGNGDAGMLGNNSVSCARTPVSVVGAKKTFCYITSGVYNVSHAAAIDAYGQVWTWGVNSFGQLGDNTTVSKRTPVSIVGNKKTFCKIHSGNSCILAIDQYGRLWGWGDNTSGKLGDNTSVSKRTPVSVLGTIKTFCEIASYNQTLAIDKYGQVWGWGANVYGAIGDNTKTGKSTPVSIAGAKKTFCKITCGDTYSHGIDQYGQVWGWGDNVVGQLGDGTYTERLTPKSIAGAKKTFCSISDGYEISIAIDKYGKLWSWGNYFRYGDNSGSSNTPKSIPGATRTFCDVVAMYNNAIAIDKNNQIWVWGENQFGQLAKGFTYNTPVSICGF